jgi:hypothetical protein
MPIVEKCRFFEWIGKCLPAGYLSPHFLGMFFEKKSFLFFVSFNKHFGVHFKQKEF